MANDDRGLPAERPGDVQEAWDAYRAMCRSKQRYFGLLSRLQERKRKEGGGPTLAEGVQLKKLLAAHGECTRRFRRSMAELNERDPRAHASLLERIARVAE